MKNSKKIIGLLSLPIILIILTSVLFVNASQLPKPLASALPYISHGLFLFGMLLSIRFNKSKVFFLCLVLEISQLLFPDSAPFLSSLNKHMPDLSDIISFLIPINILLFSASKEKGIFSLWGKVKFGALIVQAFFAILLLDPPNHDLRSLISYRFIDIDWINAFAVPQLSILLFFIALMFLIIRSCLAPTLMDSTLTGAAALTLAGLAVSGYPPGLSLFFSAAGLLLVLSLLETSHFMAYRDELTGLPSRRALEEHMQKLGSRFSIAMLDIDHFKKFNDTHGHDTGDKVLQRVAASLMEADHGGKVFRYGGEEFTILFPNRTLAEAMPLLEELRKYIAHEKLAIKKKSRDKVVSKKLGVTVSIGAAERNEKNKTAGEVIQAADKALYKAKRNGRNCVSK